MNLPGQVRPCILVVDDEAPMRDVVVEILEDEGYAAASVANGADALRYLQHTSDLPAVILLDLNMPIMSGWDFRLAQLNDPRLAAIPVVAFSAGATVQRQAHNINAAGYLPKPVEYMELVRTIAALCAADV
ncbi:MAG: response regulator [Chloroflexota bacterium]|nr:response regulator [Chloroflexota bacterium]